MKKAANNNEALYDKKYYVVKEAGYWNEDRADHKRIIELLKAKKTDRVLEIGCGYGVLLQKFPSKIKVGIENNDYAIKEIKKRGLQGIKADAERGLGFKNSSFEIIIMNEVIEHFKYPDKVLKECYRLLSPRGKIIITTPVKSFFAHDFDPTHFSEMSVREFRKILEDSGFQIITHEAYGLSFVFPIMEYLLFMPFRFIRYHLAKKRKTSSKEDNSTTITAIDSIRGFADKTVLKPFTYYRKSFLGLGLGQLILAKKN